MDFEAAAIGIEAATASAPSSLFPEPEAFSASQASSTVDPAPDDWPAQSEPWWPVPQGHNVEPIANSSGQPTTAPPLLIEPAEALETTTRHVIAIDQAVNNWQGLAEQASSLGELVILSGDLDGITQISNYLQSRNQQKLDPITSFSLISHGQAGSIQLGNTWLSLNNIASHKDEISSWRESLEIGADILIWGCDVADSIDGQTFVSSLATATGADVAASTNRTGPSWTGGDVTLEYNTGNIDSRTSASLASLLSQSLRDDLAVDITLSGTVLTVAFDDASDDFVALSINATGYSATGANVTSGTGTISQLIVQDVGTARTSDLTLVQADQTLTGGLAIDANVTTAAITTSVNTAGGDVIIQSPTTLSAITVYTGSGDQTFSGPVTLAGDVTLSAVGGGDISFSGGITTQAGSTAGLSIDAGSQGAVTFSGAAATIAGSIVVTARNIEITDDLVSTSGDISLVGYALTETPVAGTFHGVWVNGSGVEVATRAENLLDGTSGSIFISGRGGNASPSMTARVYGVYVQAGAAISAAGAGTVTVRGTGGISSGSSRSTGVVVSNSVASNGVSEIRSAGGDIFVEGTAGGASSSNSNAGVAVNRFGRIAAGGSGRVTVIGTGTATGGSGSSGVIVQNGGDSLAAPTAAITSTDGGISVTGTAADGAAGVVLLNEGSIASGGANAVTIFADSLTLGTDSSIGAGTITAGSQGSSTLQIAPRTAGTRIDLGGDDVRTGPTRTLGLTVAEIGRLHATDLFVGDETLAGPVFVSQPLAPTSVEALTILTDAGLTLAADIATTADQYYRADITLARDVRLASESRTLDLAEIGFYTTTGLARGVATSADGGIVYVADATSGLVILDVSDPSAPTLLGSADNLGAAQEVALSADGTKAYVAAGASGLRVIDVSDPRNPTLAGSVATGTAADVAVVPGGQYVAVTSSEGGLVLVSVVDPNAPTVIGTYSGTLSGSAGVTVSADGTLVYLCDFNDGLTIVDITNPAAPQLRNSLSLGVAGVAADVALSPFGNLAYVTDTRGQLWVVDVSNVLDLTAVSTLAPTDAGGYLGLEVSADGETVFIATFETGGVGANGLTVVNVSDPTAPTVLDTLSLDAPAFTLALSAGDGVAYAADGSGGLRVVDYWSETAGLGRLTFDGTVNGPGGLTLAGASVTSFYNDIGQATGLADLALRSDQVSLGGSVTTSGGTLAIDSGPRGNTAVVLASNSLLDTTANGASSAGADITISGTITSRTNSYNLQIQAGNNGDVTLTNTAGVAGSDVALGSLVIRGNDISLNSINGVIGNTDVAAQNGADTGSITLTGQTYSTSGGFSLSAGPRDSSNVVSNPITLSGGIAGSTTTFSTAGGMVELSGAIDLNQRNLSINTTTSGAAANGGDIYINDSVNGSGSLTLNAGTIGSISVNHLSGKVGDTTPLTAITVVDAGNASFGRDINAGTVAITDTTGNITFQGVMNISTGITTGAQPYNLSFLGGNGGLSSIAGHTTFTNTGALQLGDAGNDTFIFWNGVTATAASGITVSGIIKATTGDITIGDSDSDVRILGAGTFGGDATGNITLADVTLTESASLLLGTGINNTLQIGSITGTAGGLSEAVTINTTSSATISGAVGNGTGNLRIANSGGSTFESTVTTEQISIDATTGTVTFQAALVAGSLNTAVDSYAVALLGNGSTITGNTTFLNTGGVTLGDGNDGIMFTDGLTSTASTTTIAGTISTSDADLILGAASLAADVSMNAGTGNISFSNTVVGPGSLDATGTSILVGNGLGSGSNPLSSLTLNGNSTLSGYIYTETDQIYNGTVIINGSTRLNTSASSLANLRFTGLVDGDGIGGSDSLAFDLYGNNTLTMEAAVGSQQALESITVNGGGSVALQSNVTTTGQQSYSAANLTLNGTYTTSNAAFDNGFASSTNTTLTGNTTITTGSGDVSLGNVAGNLADTHTLTINSSGTSSLRGGSVGRLASLIVSGGDARIGGMATSGSQLYGGNLRATNPSASGNPIFSTAAGDLNIAGTTTLAANGTVSFEVQGGQLLFAGTVDNNDNPSPVSDLRINASNDVIFGNSLGSIRPLLNLSVTTPGNVSLAGNVTTWPGSGPWGIQTYNGKVLLAGDATLTGLSATLGQGIDGSSHNLTLNLVDAVAVGGGVAGLGNLTSNGTGAVRLAGAITTSGDQDYTGAITLSANTTLTAGGDISFRQTLDGAHSLNVTNAANVSFEGDVGGTKVLADLTVNAPTGVIDSNSAEIKAGGVSFHATNQTVAAIQTSGAVNGSLGSGNITLNATTNLSALGNLTATRSITTGAGDISFNVGTQTLQVTASNGSVSIGGNTTIGGFGGGLLVGANDGNITFGGALNECGTTAAFLDSTGDILFGGEVRDLEILEIVSANNVTASHAIRGVEGFVQVNGAGTATYNNISANTALGIRSNGIIFTGSNYTSGSEGIAIEGSLSLGQGGLPAGQLVTIETLGGNLSTNGTIYLNADLSIASGTGSSSLNSTITGTRNLSVTGSEIELLQGLGSSTSSLASTTLIGNTSLDGNTFTSGNQTYSGSLTLLSDSTLSASNVSLDLLDGSNHSLTISANATLNNSLSNLDQLLISGDTQLAANISTSGNQSYTGLVTLNNDSVLSGGTPSFSAGLSGNAHDLTLNFSGTTALNGALFSGIRNLSVGNGGSTTLTGNLTTSGNQTYSDSLSLLSDSTLLASNVSLDLLDGSNHSLTISANATLNNSLSNLDQLLISGNTQLAANISTSGNQSYIGLVTLNNDAVLSGGTPSFSAGLSGNAHDLTLNFSGTTALDGALFSGIHNLSVGNGGSTTLTGNLTTSGNQTYSDSLSLLSDSTTASTGAGTVLLENNIDGPHTLTIETGGSANLGGANTVEEIVITDGVATISSSAPQTSNYVLTGGTLKGSGNIGDLNASGSSTIAPGNSPGRISAASITLSNTSTVAVEIEGLTAQTGYDQIVVGASGAATLNSAQLTLQSTINPAIGSTFIILDNQSSTPINGTFSDLPEGSYLTVGSRRYHISYYGGDGNDITLTAMALPISAKDLLNRGRRFYKKINFGDVDFCNLTRPEYKRIRWRYVHFGTISQGSIGAESLNWNWINYRILGGWNYKSMRNDAVNLGELSQKTLRAINANPQSAKRFSFKWITQADATTAEKGQKITIYQSNSLPRVINSANTNPSLFSFKATPGSLTFNGFLAGSDVLQLRNIPNSSRRDITSRQEQNGTTVINVGRRTSVRLPDSFDNSLTLKGGTLIVD